MNDLIIQAFDNVIKREIAEADQVREEIKRRGTYWCRGRDLEAAAASGGAAQAA